MKNIRILISIIVALSVVSCEDSGKGAGNATVGFASDTYTFSESDGTVSIPVVFTGEPAEYPIVFGVSASVEDGMPVDQVASFVQMISSMRYNGKGDVVIDIEIKDNFDENPDRNLVLEITSADGAEIVGGRTVITITDNDGDIYDALQGIWTFSSILDDGTLKMFQVKIDAGESISEIQENTERRRLRVLGWENLAYSNDDPPLPYAWYLDIKYEESLGKEILWTVPDIPLIDSPGDPLGIGVQPCEIRLGVAPVTDGQVDKDNVSLSFEIPAEWSEDLRTVTFVENRAIIPLIYQNGTFTNKIYNIHTKVTLTR